MSREITETKAAKQDNVVQPVELHDDKLDAVSGGYTREEWVLINKAINERDGC